MFNLTRYFSTLSFVLMALAAGLLTLYYRSIADEQLLRHEQNRSSQYPSKAHIVNRTGEPGKWSLER